MTTAVAAPPSTTSSSLAPVRHPSPRHYALAPTSAASASPSNAAHEPSKRPRSNASPTHGARSNSNERTTASAKVSPNSHRSAIPPMIQVKKEPSSPNMQSARPRPKRLDLSSSTPGARSGPQTARPSAPLTARDSAGLAIQDVGLACLSPGFQTHDPAMRNQLQRSLDVRDQQRQIIEARQKGVKPSSSNENSDGGARTQDTTLFGVQTRTPTTSRRKGPPPGLSINAPAAEQFAHDRVIQSAPLHQTFTGLRPGEPYTRHAQHGPSGLSQTSHIHHVPATQTNNRLPPIADVFANDRLDGPRPYPANESPGRASQAAAPPPVPSPGFPPAHAQQHPASVAPLSSRSREFRSADEAVQSLTHGRDELRPKVVHYGGVQPPTPPSPMPPGGHGAAIRRTYAVPGAHHDFHPPPATARPDLGRTSSTAGRRRGRDEYERDNGSPPSAFNRPEPKRAAFAVRGDDGGSGSREDDWRQNMSGAEKREEFLRLCERAWDLFHS